MKIKSGLGIIKIFPTHLRSSSISLTFIIKDINQSEIKKKYRKNIWLYHFLGMANVFNLLEINNNIMLKGCSHSTHGFEYLTSPSTYPSFFPLIFETSSILSKKLSFKQAWESLKSWSTVSCSDGLWRCQVSNKNYYLKWTAMRFLFIPMCYTFWGRFW